MRMMLGLELVDSIEEVELSLVPHALIKSAANNEQRPDVILSFIAGFNSSARCL